MDTYSHTVFPTRSFCLTMEENLDSCHNHVELGSALIAWAATMCQELSSALTMENKAPAFRELCGYGVNRGINTRFCSVPDKSRQGAMGTNGATVHFISGCF